MRKRVAAISKPDPLRPCPPEIMTSGHTLKKILAEVSGMAGISGSLCDLRKKAEREVVRPKTCGLCVVGAVVRVRMSRRMKNDLAAVLRVAVI